MESSFSSTFAHGEVASTALCSWRCRAASCSAPTTTKPCSAWHAKRGSTTSTGCWVLPCAAHPRNSKTSSALRQSRHRFHLGHYIRDLERLRDVVPSAGIDPGHEIERCPLAVKKRIGSRSSAGFFFKNLRQPEAVEPRHHHVAHEAFGGRQRLRRARVLPRRRGPRRIVKSVPSAFTSIARMSGSSSTTKRTGASARGITAGRGGAPIAQR